MISVTHDDIGRTVIYRDSGGKTEIGVITSFNAIYVHIRYGDGSTSMATSPKDLEWPEDQR
jgi:hypothetical protein